MTAAEKLLVDFLGGEARAKPQRQVPRKCGMCEKKTVGVDRKDVDNDANEEIL